MKAEADSNLNALPRKLRVAVREAIKIGLAAGPDIVAVRPHAVLRECKRTVTAARFY